MFKSLIYQSLIFSTSVSIEFENRLPLKPQVHQYVNKCQIEVMNNKIIENEDEKTLSGGNTYHTA